MKLKIDRIELLLPWTWSQACSSQGCTHSLAAADILSTCKYSPITFSVNQIILQIQAKQNRSKQWINFQAWSFSEEKHTHQCSALHNNFWRQCILFELFEHQCCFTEKKKKTVSLAQSNNFVTKNFLLPMDFQIL